MRNARFLEYRQLLAAAEREAHERLAQGKPGLTIEVHGDPIDNLIEALDREHSITTSMQASQTLRQIREAFHRIEQGSYGECVVCGEPISVKRLHALPWTPNCLTCQQQIDENHATDSEADTRSAA